MLINNVEGFAGNCGMQILSGFESELTYKVKDSEIIGELKGLLRGATSLVAFSGSDWQVFACQEDKTRSTWGPQQFADWLKKKGEKVTSTAYILNYSSGNKIKAFYWSPSLKFRKKLGLQTWGG